MLNKIIISLSLLFALPCNAQVELKNYENSIYSQYGEDGVLAKIFEIIGMGTKFCVELGAGDGMEGCTRLLRQQGWHTILLDRSCLNPHIHLFKEFITTTNINDLFSTYSIPQKLQLLCIDTGYNDYYLWKALSSLYQPTVVVVRYNPCHLPTEDRIVKHRPYFGGDATSYYGASIVALQKLGESKGYSLIYAETSGHYLFFIRNEVVKEHKEFKAVNDVAALYPFDDRSKPLYYDPKQRLFISSDELAQ